MKTMIFSLVVVLMLVMTACSRPMTPLQISQKSNGVQIQLAMLLDGSTSITAEMWTLTVDGVAGAIDGASYLQRSPTDNSGAFTNPTNAYADGGGYAQATNGNVHYYYGYNFSIPSEATIGGIQVRLDAWRQAGSGQTGSIGVELSWNGGTNWTSAGYGTGSLTGSESSRYAGSPTSLWGHNWTPSEVNTGLRVRLSVIATGWVRLDWAPVTVYYQTEGCVPHDGSVELTVIQFGGSSSPGAQLEIGPVVITSSNAATVANQIRAITQMGGYTPLSCAIRLAADTLAASSNFDPNIKQVVNIVTDGVPNRCCPGEWGCIAGGDSCGTGGCAEANTSAVAARNYTITTLNMTDDQDEIDVEGIGITDTNRDWFKNNIILPATGYSSPPESWPPPGPGWVRVVASFEEFAETICEKFEIVLYGSITAHKFNDLNGDGDQDGGEGDLAGWTMTLYSGSNCSGSPLALDETNADGDVVFTGLEAGTYSVKETLEDGWTNSTALCQQVTVGAGESATLNFGNRCISPTAAFDATPTNGCAPLTVNFTDQSTGSPTGWSWNFGDGGNSTAQNPSHNYTSAGTYNVTLTVSNACGSDNETKANYITVSQAPVAAFSATPTSGCAPLIVNFTDQSIGSPTRWNWTFGDGVTSTDQNPSHQYASAGSYNVTLTVSNACGSDDETKTNYITVSGAPVAAFDATPTSGCAPLIVNFTDQSTGNPTSWSWTFGDGGTSTLQNPSHQYANTGSYNVTLTVSNACGSDDETKTNHITVSQAPVAAFSATPTSGCAPLIVNFTDQSTGNPTSWSWTFGDGDTSSAQNPTHSYANAGTYTVSLTVSNACGSDTETKTNYITVYAKPTATGSSNSPVCQGSTIVLSGDPGGMTSYNWTGPNGFSSTLQNPTISNATTLNAGTYYLMVTDGGCVSDPASTVVVVNESPTADAGADREIPEGSSVVIGGSPTASGGTPPYTYSWTPTSGLNDASIANPTASPAVNTTYTVTVIDSKGCTDSDDVTVTLAPCWCICGFVYQAGTTKGLAGWEVILEKKTSPWHEVQRTITDADGKYCFCGLENGEYRVSQVATLGWNQVSPLPNEHLVTLPGGASDPEDGPFFNFENEQSPGYGASPPTVGWETYPINKVRVLLPWIALLAAVIAGGSLLVVRRHRAQS